MDVVKLGSIILCVYFCTCNLGFCKVINDKTPDGSSGSSESFGSLSRLDNLTADLLADYGPNVRPVCPGQETIPVTVDLAVRQLITLNEPEQTVQFNVWMRLGWVDCHLKWNPDDYNGTKSVVLPIDLIWKPDITLYESISEEFYGFEKFRAHIYADGHVTYNFPSKIEALCPVSVAKFPYDSQICSLMFGSWSYNGFELDVSTKHGAGDLSSVKENVEWIIEKIPAVRHELYYGCCPEPYPDVTFYINLKRKPGYYVTNILIPSLLVTLVAGLGFFLPADSGEKVGLELTVMLAMSVFQLLIADHLPPSADETPWISSFFSFTMILSGGSSCWQVLVLNLHHRGDRPMPDWLKFYVLKLLGRLTYVDVPRVKPVYVTESQPKCDKSLAKIFNILDKNRKYKEEELGNTSSISLSEQETEIAENSELWISLALMVDRIGMMVFFLSLSIGCGYIFNRIQSVE
ncbi:neuronal acetylcholine receptor subunit alpha-10-like [Mytilus californianus]|uniref:neuronal acetylcholine receptor subunit alpha-10-like n=1 Tax=Mytilus californianus TaxID=6549 RepID=UPI00224865CF|nr:neuronal acetylcholine receptor subunit alpha-10-like [Mytilus californianus]